MTYRKSPPVTGTLVTCENDTRTVLCSHRPVGALDGKFLADHVCALLALSESGRLSKASTTMRDGFFFGTRLGESLLMEMEKIDLRNQRIRWEDRSGKDG